MIKIVGLALVFMSFSAQAMIPLEGIIMGDAFKDIQRDPLNYVFSDIYDKSKVGENKKLKLYQSTYQSGMGLNESCGLYEQPKYSTSWEEKQAKRSMVATLQYIGLDTSIKAIGAYGAKLNLSEDQYHALTKNIVGNYCSKNVTVFSLKSIEKALAHYYQNPEKEMIPSVASSPFATEAFIKATESENARSQEFDQAIRNFRAFCSWGGDDNDYRMLAPYLNNRFIMAFVIKNMSGLQDKIEETKFSIETKSSSDTVQVMCRDLVCRKVTSSELKKQLPRSVGSTGLTTDLNKLYCHHFRFLDYLPKQTLPEIAGWIKNTEIEEPVMETSFFLSLMSGVPDLTLAVEAYKDLPVLIRSSMDERWSKWATESLGVFSKDLLFEESLKVRVQERAQDFLKEKKFVLNFTVTLGEMDRLLNDSDKISATFHLKLSRNYLREMRTKWDYLSKEVDIEGQKNFKLDLAKYIDLQLAKKEHLFLQKIWNADFSRLIAEELLNQAITQRGAYFKSYEEEMIDIPVHFRYGIFAMSYLRYRSDVKNGRLKLNL